MQFSTKTFSASSSAALIGAISGLKTHCLALAVGTDDKLDPIAQAADKVLNGRIGKALAAGELAARAGSAALITTGAGAIERVLLIRLNSKAGPTQKEFTEALRAGAKLVCGSVAKDCTSLFAAQASAALDVAWVCSIEVQAVCEALYRFDNFKTQGKAPAAAISKWTLMIPQAVAPQCKRAVTQAQAIADGIKLAKDLGNSPGNVCTPSYLAQTAQTLAKSLPVKVEVFDEKQIRKLGMGSFLAVAQGSAQAPRLIVLHYNGANAKSAPHVLVGKGITFDTGGISLKPAAEMDEMKFDMCGAASVLGTVRAVAQLKLPINLIGIIPTCENMPSSTAVKPGDIVTSMSGQTIEVLNTDAEGRLILCDALTYAARFKPASMIDIATLTGACVIALGHHHSGLFTHHDALAEALLTAGKYAQDTAWRMPLDEEYQEQLKSNFADMGNVGGRAGGSITAACFLSRFVSGTPWAHLDIAGTAWRSGAAKGGTGRPVSLLTRYLINLAD